MASSMHRLDMARILSIILIITFYFPSFAQVDPQALSKEISARFERVPEFAFIQEEANKLGVKVYLFGGTASAFAHYVRWDLEREAGDTKYQKERFDYDFTNIYRGNQDLDIVVDGTTVQADSLKKILEAKFPHFIGNKTSWEVRLLKEQTGDKLPLLDNYDFLNQHTDTNSTGMLTINPGEEEIVFRDLFSWEDSESQFLKDVAAGKIKFLFSKNHEKTSRFKEGKNPPVFAAIRYLAKLAQYEVKGPPGDLNIIKKIVNEADWERAKSNSYLRVKLTEFGKKVLLNAPDSEYAWNLLEETGLREKLIEMGGNSVQKQNSLSWWMSKEPLRSKEISLGEGETAGEIFKKNLNKGGEIVVSHETSDFQAYENITRSSKGRANAFISRTDASGETAVHGDGFYTKVGREGARGTGVTIRFKLDPNARVDTDFTYNGDFVIVKNKNALTLIQENLNLSLYDFIKLMDEGAITDSDKGLMEKLKRKFGRYKAELDELEKIAEHYLVSDSRLNEKFYDYWFPNPESVNFVEIADSALEEGFDQHVIRYLLPHSHWQDFIIKKFDIQREVEKLGTISRMKFIEHVLSQPHWVEYPELVFAAMSKLSGDDVAPVVEHILSKPYWAKHPKIFREIFNKNISYNEEVLNAIVKAALSKPHWSDHPEFVELLLGNDHGDTRVFAEGLFSGPQWAKYPDLMSRFIKKESRGREYAIVAEYSLSSEHWVPYKHLISEYIEGDPTQAPGYIATYVLSKPYWYKSHPDLYSDFVENGKNLEEFIEYVLSQDFIYDKSLILSILEDERYIPSLMKHVLSQKRWKDKDLIKKILENKESHQSVLTHLFSTDSWKEFGDLLDQMVEDGKADLQVVKFVLSQPFWDRPDIIEKFIDEGRVTKEIAIHLLTQERWKNPIWLRKLVTQGKHMETIVKYVFSKDFWRSEKDLLMEVIKTQETDKEVAQYVLSDPYWEKYPEFLSQINIQGNAREEVIKYVFPNYGWKDHTAYLENIIKEEMLDQAIASSIFSKPGWTERPEILVSLITAGLAEAAFLNAVLKREEWANHPVLLDFLEGRDMNVRNIRDRSREIRFEQFLFGSCGALLE